MTTIFVSAILLASILALGTLAVPALAELDVQVYRGEGAIGIIVSEGIDSGFEIALDENSFVTVTGTNVSSFSDNETTVEEGVYEIVDNETGVSNDTAEDGGLVIEIPHIGNVTVVEQSENVTEFNENITSSDDVIEQVTGVNVTAEVIEEVGDNGTAVEEGVSIVEDAVVVNGTEEVAGGNDGLVVDDYSIVVASGEEECIGGTLTEGYEEQRDFRICYLN
jgi:hypothetical protein